MPLLVLDTHVLLDLWLFEDARLSGLAHAIQVGQVRWLATGPMLEELGHVSRRSWGPRWTPALLLADAGQLCELHNSPSVAAPWRSQDPDDQKFLDLAWACRPVRLWSRDHALLRWRKRALTEQIRIEKPEEGWAALQLEWSPRLSRSAP